MHDRLSIMEKLPGPGLLGGIAPAAPPGSAAMLHNYVVPEERLVACPNQDVVYGFGIIDGHRGPSVVQVPDFGGRFWVYQGVDQRTDSFIRLGAMYGTKPGPYLLAPQSWDGAVPAGITGVFRFDTRIAICIPRVFMDDTDADRAAIQDVINQVMLYPLDQYTGEPQTTDWSKAPVFPAGDATGGEHDPVGGPGRVLRATAEVMAEIPARPGEEAWYECSARCCTRPPRTPRLPPCCSPPRPTPTRSWYPGCSSSATSACPAQPLEHPAQRRDGRVHRLQDRRR
jgi:hypothetical protein